MYITAQDENLYKRKVLRCSVDLVTLIMCAMIHGIFEGLGFILYSALKYTAAILWRWNFKDDFK